eukprot:NODE_43_length_2491_cov_367.983990.p1 GENE.NODE_43_length_2491_cov_367.983990~~NODE_43_length_2491_cov_367.983990.p1  ORF type:complete len:755 (+),score=193.25 NODE_43_length_2491_cov_367.983990:79-2343(+)
METGARQPAAPPHVDVCGFVEGVDALHKHLSEQLSLLLEDCAREVRELTHAACVQVDKAAVPNRYLASTEPPSENHTASVIKPVSPRPGAASPKQKAESRSQASASPPEAAQDVAIECTDPSSVECMKKPTEPRIREVKSFGRLPSMEVPNEAPEDPQRLPVSKTTSRWKRRLGAKQMKMPPDGRVTVLQPVDRASRVRLPDDPFLGIWVDQLGSFFGGCYIAICDDAWQPVSPILELHKLSTFKLHQDCPTHYVLHQQAPNGIHRRYDLTPGEDGEDTMLVSLAGAQLTWTLTRATCNSALNGSQRAITKSGSNTYLREYRESTSSILEPLTCFGRSRKQMGEVLQSTAFEVVIGLVIFANAVTLGVDAELDLTNDSPQWLSRLEHVFLAIYTAEICMRLISFGAKANIRKGWFIFDLVLVTSGISYSWVVKPASPSRGDGGMLGQIVALRLLRFLRLMRVLRMLPLLKPAWRMVSGLLESWSTMMSMLVLLVLALYLFACLGLEVITKDALVQETLQEHDLVAHFDSLGVIMLTLVQFVTLDSCAGIYYPIIKNHPELLLYFFPVIVIVSISLMNLVTAVLVEGGMALAHKDGRRMRDERFRKIKLLEPELREFFRRVDADSSGTIQAVEMEHIAPSCYPDGLKDRIRPEWLVDLWDILDDDGSGDVNEAEFVDGLLNLCLAGNDVISKDTLKLTRFMNAALSKSAQIEKTVQLVKAELNTISHGLTRLASAVEIKTHRTRAVAPCQGLIGF